MNLKQKIAYGLSFFYLINVVGFALSLHFCGGKLSGVRFYDNTASCKMCAGFQADKKADADCCKSTKIDVKVKDDHQSETSFKLPELFGVYLFLPELYTVNFSFLSAWVFALCDNKTSPLKKSGIYLLNCVFRN